MGWEDIIGWAGSALVVVSLVQTRILRLRVLNLIGSLVLLGFNVLIEVWPMVGLNTMLALINIIQLRKLVGERHDERAYKVLEVNATDSYLQHLLSEHAEDIVKFNPGFDPLELTGQTLAFLVQLGDSTTGVVLAHPTGDGKAQIDLDYVLPTYRDFTPGEFVYRRSDVFARHGIKQVVARADMRQSAPYLARVGFTLEGADLVLVLPN